MFVIVLYFISIVAHAKNKAHFISNKLISPHRIVNINLRPNNFQTDIVTRKIIETSQASALSITMVMDYSA